MHIAQLLDALAITPHVEIIKSPLPHMFGYFAEQCPLPSYSPLAHLSQHSPREPLRQRLHHLRRITFLWFADQQMHMFRHNDVTNHYDNIALAHLLQNFEQQVAATSAGEPVLAVIATASDEMEMIVAVVALRMAGHEGSLRCDRERKCDG